MRMLLASVLVLSLAFGAGCGREEKTKVKETKSTPGGSTTTTTEKSTKSTGDNPPKNSAGESVPPKNP